ncbi:CPBP family intramembrane glutamic endopeptidase [Streptococcus sp. CSL10205-OR2]|uniref:CPBP family intramembrane glutamic endopeptidase n=1 Tax=Streptococcus sp. CSL10205-OR2 TaxID=2980558 RepID=UPI0021D8438E|nr:type II CAAX endopeptidase family protein [Streptococcus sp. CSL10205-OR2]MCU9533955.1 CPBP family intramembrane metalloprotease [Streptococcus sp. CSL10205-OR2]
MKKTFIAAKQESKFNLGWLLGPLVGFILLTLAETISFMVIVPFFMYQIPPLEIQLFGFIFISLTVVFWARVIEKSPWQGIGFTKTKAFQSFLSGWGIGTLMMFICVFLMFLFGGLTFTGYQLSPTLIVQFLILMIAWTVQGSAEEILARGWLFSSISTRYPVFMGLIVSSLFFTILHLGNDHLSVIPILDLFLFGVLAALYMLKTNDIWGVSGIHAAWNCFQGSFFNFNVSGSQTSQAFVKVSVHGPDWLTGGDFGVEGSVFSLLVQLAVIIWLVYDLKKTNEFTLLGK